MRQCKKSEMFGHICCVEKHTGCGGMSKIKISSKDKMTNELNGHVENLKLMSMCDRVVFYSYLTEKIVIHETPIASRRHPSESHTLEMARDLHLCGSTRYEKFEMLCRT